MRKFIFVWFDKENQPHEYRTEAISREIAQGNFGTYQAKKKLHKRWSQVFEVVRGERVKL